MNKKFKPGDQVQLKSGGPTMTVDNCESIFDSPDNEESYTCHWFSDKKLNRGSFSVESLIEVKGNGLSG